MKKVAQHIFTNGRIIALISAILLAISAALPWASTENVRVLGVEGDGAITILIGIIAMLFLFTRSIPCGVSTIMGVVGLAIVIANYSSVLNIAALLKGTVESGLYLSLLGSLGIIFGSIVECFYLRHLRMK